MADDRGKGFLLWDTTSTATQILVTVAILLLFFAARYLVSRYSARHKDSAKRYRAQKIGDGASSVLVVAVLLVAWWPGASSFFGTVAIVGAGLTIALSGPLTNAAGWLYIVTHKPFGLKDRIQVGDKIAGDVIDISPFQFSLIEIGNWVDADQSTGRIVHVPNGLVFQQAVANYTQGFQFIWHEIPITITFESNWEKAHQLLTDLLERFSADVQVEAEKQMREASSRFMVHYTRLTPIVWVKVCDFGVTLTLRYLCEARRRRGSETVLWMEVLRALAMEPDIDLAYPTQRFYDNRQEGKPGAGGPPLDAQQVVGVEAIPELSEMTMSIGNLKDVYARTRAEVVLPGESEDIELEESIPISQEVRPDEDGTHGVRRPRKS